MNASALVGISPANKTPPMKHEGSYKNPAKRKLTRKDSILNKILNQDSQAAYKKLQSHLVSYSTNIETLMDIFKAKSYMQTIKSKQRQSETLIIEK